MITLPDDNDRKIAALPFLRCKAINVTTLLVDAGFASPHEVDALGDRIKGSVVLANINPEPFTAAEPFTARIVAAGKGWCGLCDRH